MSCKGEMMHVMMASMPEGVSVKKADYLPLYAEWLTPVGADEDKVILYFHGGSFVMGNVKSHRCIVGNFVKAVGYKALLFDYHLAPEFPAPATVNDSAAIYCWMLEQGYEPESIIFAGDSAGGGIEIGTLIKLKNDGIPLPAACVAFSPSLDMTISGESHKTLAGLPPIMIHVGNDEVMRDDSTRFGEKADLAGVNVSVKVWKDMFHYFPLLSPMFAEATEAMKQVSSFIKRHMQNDDRVLASFLYGLVLLI